MPSGNNLMHLTKLLVLFFIGDKKVPCTRLAMVYYKPAQDQFQLNVPSPSKMQLSSSPADQMQRKLHNNRLFENKLLNAFDIVAVIPAP